MYFFSKRETTPKGVKIITQFDPSLPNVAGDETQLAQVLRNIMSERSASVAGYPRWDIDGDNTYYHHDRTNDAHQRRRRGNETWRFRLSSRTLRPGRGKGPRRPRLRGAATHCQNFVPVLATPGKTEQIIRHT